MAEDTSSQTIKPVMLSNAIQMLQLLTLIVGLVLVSASMGAKGEKLDRHDADLRDLKSIIQDLVKFQISSSKDIEHLKELEQRARALETNGNSR